MQRCQSKRLRKNCDQTATASRAKVARCVAGAALFVSRPVLAQGNQLLPCLAYRGKVPSRCTTIQLDERSEAYQWSGSEADANEESLLTRMLHSPRRKVSSAPLGIQEVPKRYTLFLKEREYQRENILLLRARFCLWLEAEQGSSSLECVCFDQLSRSKWNVTRSGWV